MTSDFGCLFGSRKPPNPGGMVDVDFPAHTASVAFFTCTVSALLKTKDTKFGAPDTVSAVSNTKNRKFQGRAMAPSEALKRRAPLRPCAASEAR